MARKNRQKAAAARPGMSPFVIVLIVAAVVGIGVVGYAVTSSTMPSSAAVAPVEVDGLDDPQRLMELAQGVVRGDPNAPIKIVEFADYQCPACQMFASQVKPRIDLAYIETGQAHMVFYDFPLRQHVHAFLAARAARCAGDQDGYWDFHDALFANQPTWSVSTSPMRLFGDYAQGLGLDRGAFEACLSSDRHADLVTANMRLGEELQVMGTPTVMVSRGDGMARRVPEFGFDAIAEAVQALQQQGG